MRKFFSVFEVWVPRGYRMQEYDIKGSPALVKWDNICLLEKQGGLGLKHLYEWNVYSIGKYAWWISIKADHLWVRWVHSVYLKQTP